ncbi:MAG: HDIG domain-containing metalloprotein [Christensenellales bacterium]|jgi:putative nucleotidyltransferase with HDIG domain|nr:HDIG domain-containing protein [Clostridiales bacterium]
MEDTTAKLANARKAKKKALLRYLVIFIFSIFAAFVIKIIDAGFLGFGEAIKQTKTIFQLLSLIFTLTVILSALLYYITQTKKEALENPKLLAVILSAFVLTLILSFLFGSLISVYIMPLTLCGLFIGILIDKKIAVMANIMLITAFFICFCILYDAARVAQIAVSMLSGMIAGTYMILMMEKTYTRMKFLFNGVAVSLLIIPVAIFISAITNPQYNDILFVGLWAFLSVLLSVSLFITLLPVFERVFRLSTNFGLQEICSFDAKLLKRLSAEAPGTFNHSLAVGNLAQLCALAIGENPQLARAGAYYHDIGKLKEPLCFVENQKDYNPHDDFIPEVSVSIITSHTKYGYELIKRERLPDIIADIALEHHGTTPVNYFYNKVKKLTEEQVEKKDFSYAGPIPSNKISAIIMIVDTVEAATRAQSFTDVKHLRELIHKLIEEKRQLGQFDNCDLTFKQLKKIEDTLVEAMPGIFHSRISYEEK